MHIFLNVEQLIKGLDNGETNSQVDYTLSVCPFRTGRCVRLKSDFRDKKPELLNAC
jgi:hypothetical protein